MTDQEFYEKFVIPKFTKKSQIEFLEMAVFKDIEKGLAELDFR